MAPGRPTWARATDGPLTAALQRTPGGFGLGQVPAGLRPDATTRTVCGFCSTGCSLDVHLRDGQAVNLTPTVGHPVNLGMACPKGWEALTPLRSPDRATQPLLRDERGRLQPVGWSRALEAFVSGVREVQERHGPSAMAFLSTGQIPIEEMALLGTLAKFGMGMVHGDGNTRQCMATAVVAYKESFGFDAPPYTYDDFEQSDVIVLWGSNLAIAHPIMWERVARNRHDPAIVVVDPRRTETAAAASLHVPVRPKGDLDLLYGLAHLLLAQGAVDRSFVEAHTRGFAEFAEFLAGWPPERVTASTGVSAELLQRFADLIAGGRRVSFWWTMGVNQSHQGVRTAQAIINLALMTGNIGRPGTGANSITGQCNAMGSRLYSNTTSLLGGRDFADEGDRTEVADALAIDAARIPRETGWAYDQIVEGIATGDIRGLWIIATNPAHSWIGSGILDELLGRLDLLVVQDMYTTTETAQRADLLLPAAAWGEKEGTFISSERRFGVVKRVARAPGQALADFSIFHLIAEAWGCADVVKALATPEDAFAVLRELSRARPHDFTGIAGYAAIEAAGGIQWPLPEGTSVADAGTERRLFADGRFHHPDGRARFVFDAPRPVAEAASTRHPLVLLTGRGSSSEWHTRTRTGKSATLRALSAQHPYVELNPADAARLGIEAEETVVVASARGSVRALARVTGSVAPGQVFMPMHDAATNLLTMPSVDPHSRQPSYKHAAVEVRRLHHWER
jgi:anaerobic selenocysteine-containing dehydrogenase